jgi:hypothetical protein
LYKTFSDAIMVKAKISTAFEVVKTLGALHTGVTCTKLVSSLFEALTMSMAVEIAI